MIAAISSGQILPHKQWCFLTGGAMSLSNISDHASSEWRFIYLSSGVQSCFLFCSYLFTPYDLKGYYALKKKITVHTLLSIHHIEIYIHIYIYILYTSYIGSFWFDTTVWISVAPVVRIADCDGGGVPKTSELVHWVLAQQEEPADWIQTITKVCLGGWGVMKKKHSEWRQCCCFTWNETQLLAVDV